MATVTRRRFPIPRDLIRPFLPSGKSLTLTFPSTSRQKRSTRSWSRGGGSNEYSRILSCCTTKRGQNQLYRGPGTWLKGIWRKNFPERSNNRRKGRPLNYSMGYHQTFTASTFTTAGTWVTTVVCRTICISFCSHPSGRVLNTTLNRSGSLMKSAEA